jgi:hypothetical protein
MSNQKGVRRIEVPKEFLKQLSFARRWMRIDDNTVILKRAVLIPEHLLKDNQKNLKKYVRKLRKLLERQEEELTFR